MIHLSAQRTTEPSCALDSDSFRRFHLPQNLGKCVSAVNQLNRNIENVTQVGDGIEPVHNLWSQFQDVMQSGSYADAVRPFFSFLLSSLFSRRFILLQTSFLSTRAVLMMNLLVGGTTEPDPSSKRRHNPPSSRSRSWWGRNGSQRAHWAGDE
jgi:hypothetical protein